MKNIPTPSNNKNSAVLEKPPAKIADDPAPISTKILPKIIIGVLIASFIFGGVAGLLFGTLASTDASVSRWVQKNIFGKTAVAGISSSVSGQAAISVQEESSTIDAVKKVDPAVVSIVVSQDISKYYNSTSPFFFFQFGNQNNQPQSQGQQEVGAGTGFIISSDGMILTNKHVVNTADAQYTVVMNNGKKYEAKVVATDPFNDIALVKIEAKDLPVVELGDSDSLQVGQTVIAIGNTLGEYNNTVTKGVISGLSRTVTAGDGSGQAETLRNIVQTDAAINFGNSGGPLINLAGQVIGVNTAINQSGQLVGFAIPINQAKKDIQSVQQTGKIVRPYLGVRYLLITSEIAKQNKLSVDYGALIVRGSSAAEVAVVPGSPADKAGLVENDIILEINGQAIDQNHPLADELQKYNVGDTITLKILHDGQEKTVPATLDEAK
jgi:serine protease Do